ILRSPSCSTPQKRTSSTSTACSRCKAPMTASPFQPASIFTTTFARAEAEPSDVPGSAKRSGSVADHLDAVEQPATPQQRHDSFLCELLEVVIGHGAEENDGAVHLLDNDSPQRGDAMLLQRLRKG